jgi:hypothetical protein
MLKVGYTQGSTGEMCVVPKQAGFKPTGFEPNPVKKLPIG